MCPTFDARARRPAPGLAGRGDSAPRGAPVVANRVLAAEPVHDCYRPAFPPAWRRCPVAPSSRLTLPARAGLRARARKAVADPGEESISQSVSLLRSNQIKALTLGISKRSAVGISRIQAALSPPSSVDAVSAINSGLPVSSVSAS